MPDFRPTPFIALPLLTALLAACASSSPRTSPPATATPPASSLAHFVRILASDNYTVSHSTQGTMPDGTHLYVFSSVCTGSADGHCGAVDVFQSTSIRPLWHHQYMNVPIVRMLSHGFSVQVATYAPNDPLCCPSLPAVTDTYTWNGHGFNESGPLPHAPGG